MTAELVEDAGFVRLPLPPGRDSTWADLQEIPEDNGHRYEIVDGMHEFSDEVYREVRTVRAGESVVVDVPFAVRVRPAELTGPRRRS